MTERQNRCAKCGNKTPNHRMICDACAPAYLDDGCGQCIPCKSGLTHIMPCQTKERAHVR